MPTLDEVYCKFGFAPPIDFPFDLMRSEGL